jgi:hypothetical protein
VNDSTGKENESWCVLQLSLSNKIYLRFATLFHQIVPFILNIAFTLILLSYVSRSKSHVYKKGYFVSFIKVLYSHLEFFMAPLVCFISQCPQIIILFLDSCQFINGEWFTLGTLMFYYFSFVPQCATFFIYIVPSPLYKEELAKITLVKMIIRRWKDLLA